MKIVKASYEIVRPDPIDGIAELKHLERCARTAYKSEDKITDDGESAKRMIKRLIESGHESTLEHGGMTVKFIVDRGVSHEMVRHRIASFTQESTRYCNYSQDKFGNEITVIEPIDFYEVSEDFKNIVKSFWDKFAYDATESFTEINFYSSEGLERAWENWFTCCLNSEICYFNILHEGVSPQIARSVLPNSLKTEIEVTANWREWRHILDLRSDISAHPQFREVAKPLLKEMHEKIPVLFDDIYEKYWKEGQ